ncbi:MAG: hypothetical protein J5I93_20540 [Pirellulaceae bacterium]|nr:hypothetical protein [Pirellulaceae bacterium]
MVRRFQPNLKKRTRLRNRSLLIKQRSRFSVAARKLGRGAPSNHQGPFVPPEDWHEPSETPLETFEVVIQEPGQGYRHVVTERQIRERLSLLPAAMLAPLEVVQLSRMTRKKRTYPCYGMQWGNAVYLYPVETHLAEYFRRPPAPAVYNETRMYGGRWTRDEPGIWTLQWTERSIQDYYLNNVLIHELGHLLDQRNSSYRDRERFAEWFAIEYGYTPSRRTELAARGVRKLVRRHHAK